MPEIASTPSTNQSVPGGNPPPRIEWGEAALLLGVALAAMLPTLLGRDLWRFDEVRWAQVARELSHSHNWFVLRLLGQYYPDKPPFYFWVSAGLMKLVGGANPVTPRLVSAFSIFGVALITWRLGSRVPGRRIGLWGGMLWLSSMVPGVLSTSVAVDPFYSVWVVGANAATGFAIARRRWGTGLGIAFCFCVAAAMFTKGPVGLALPLVTLLVAWAVGVPMPKGTHRPVVWSIVASVTPTVFWLIQAARSVGLHQILSQVGMHGFGYAAHSWSHAEPPWFFLGTFWRDFFPASVLFPAALAAFWLGSGSTAAAAEGKRGWWSRLRASAANRPMEFFLLAWFFGIFILHSAASGKRSPYIMPAFPAAALLIAWAFLGGGGEAAASDLDSRARRVFRALSGIGRWLVVATLVVLGLAALAHPLYFGLVVRRITKIMSDTPGLKLPSLTFWQHAAFYFGGVVALALAWLAARGKLTDRRPRAMLLGASVGAGLLILFLAGAVGGPLLNPLRSGRSLTGAVAPYVDDPDTTVLFRTPGPAWLVAWHLHPKARLVMIGSTYRFGLALHVAKPRTVVILSAKRYHDDYEDEMPSSFHSLGKGLSGTETFLIFGKGIPAPATGPEPHP